MKHDNPALTPEAIAGTYPKNTIGYHYLLSAALFGTDSPATKFLAHKAAQCDKGLNEPVLASEEQIVMMLGALHTGSIAADDKGNLIADHVPIND